MKTLKEIYNNFNTTSPVDGGDKGTIHSYIDEYYEIALAPYRDSAQRVLEIGINQGHSLMMWEEYFLNAEIIGVDIKVPDIKTRCKMVEGDATDPKTFASIDEVDVIIDDGSHLFKHQIKSFNLLFPKLKAGGIYIIEDIKDIDATREAFLKLHSSVRIVDLRNIKNRRDDVIIEIKK